MSTSLLLLIRALVVLLSLDALVVIGVMVVKQGRRRAFVQRTARNKTLREALQNRDGAALNELARQHPVDFAVSARLALEACSDGGSSLKLVREAFEAGGVFAMAKKDCHSLFRYKRLRAYLSLGLGTYADDSRALLDCLEREHDYFGRLVLIRQLAGSSAGFDVGELAKRLALFEPPLDERGYSALIPLAPRFASYHEGGGQVTGEVGLRLFLMGLKAHPTQAGWDKAVLLAETREDGLGELAAETLAAAFPPSWFLKAFRARRERRFMLPTARLLGGELAPEDVGQLDPWFEDKSLLDAGVEAVREIDRRNPEGITALINAIETGSAERAAGISLALEYRMHFIAFHALTPLQEGYKRMISCLLERNRSGSILSTLESPLPAPVRSEMLQLLEEELAAQTRQRDFFSRNAGPELRAQLQLPPPPPEEDRPRIPVKRMDKVFIGFLVILALAVFPTVFVLRWGQALTFMTGSELLYRFIFEFHFLFAWYTIAVNSFYLALLALSALKLQAQSVLWETGFKHFLFSSGLLPPITVIAPAYNEESTIVDSVESLLALAYPHYQVVVVNDGSKDDTIGQLVRGFNLVPASPGTEGTLLCMPVKTVYRSTTIPNLVVVDKTNGGKADALNAGSNFATGQYLCSIDADSLLDPQSLLRAMLQTIASKRIVIAIGGNIFPVNGSEVEHGHLQRIGLPSEPLAAFQTMEYLRSFVSGRLGWVLLDGLLIISGAFGIFRKDRFLEVGGYMTGRGVYRKDTVGEDMELVVRLVQHERRSGRDGMVDYCYNANCWTEVPEDGKTLMRQRDRWHRGLIEVLLHHRNMAFRPRYGMSGILSIPYFYVFELIGPWLELSGYLVLATSLFLALIDPFVSLVVFGIAVAFGILISLCSILLAERQVLYFKPKDFFGLLLLAFVENFGFRQLMSMSRVWAFVQFFYRSKGWQKFARKGFSRKGGAA